MESGEEEDSHLFPWFHFSLTVFTPWPQTGKIIGVICHQVKAGVDSDRPLKDGGVRP